MQLIFPLDTLTRNSSAQSANGYAKITTGKLYRVSGQTAQLKGVVPDINLPDAFEAARFGERFEDDALPSDTVKKNQYYRPLPLLPITQLRSLSSQRVNNNKNFQEIKEAVKVETQANAAVTRVIPLKLELFENWAVENKKEDILFDEKEMEASKVFVAQNHKDDMLQFASNNYSKTINDVTLKNIQQDIYIEEAYQIILDFLKTQTKN
jgi:carboxyl-terminal processing protease